MPYYTQAMWFMDNFMQLANIQCALFFKHKQNLSAFGNVESTNLNAKQVCHDFPVTANVETPKRTAPSLSPQLTIAKHHAIDRRQPTLPSQREKKQPKTVLQSSVCDERVGRTGQDWSTSSIQFQFKFHLKQKALRIHTHKHYKLLTIGTD